MGQAVKFAFLGAAILVLLGLIGGIIGEVLPVGSLMSGWSQTVGTFMGYILPTLMNVKGAINYFLGDVVVITAFNYLILVSLLLEVIMIPIRVTTSVYKWVSK